MQPINTLKTHQNYNLKQLTNKISEKIYISIRMMSNRTQMCSPFNRSNENLTPLIYPKSLLIWRTARPLYAVPRSGFIIQINILTHGEPRNCHLYSQRNNEQSYLTLKQLCHCICHAVSICARKILCATISGSYYVCRKAETVSTFVLYTRKNMFGQQKLHRHL